MEETKKPLNILVINCDWRDIFRDKFFEQEEKLERDCFNPKFNRFYFFSWAHVSYSLVINDRFQSRHQKIFGPYFKPLYEFLSIIYLLLYAKKTKVKFDIVTTYDFGLLPAAWLAAKLYGGQLVMTINNMPRIYSSTRKKFSGLKIFYSFLSEKFFYRLPQIYFTINQAMKNYLIGIGVPTGRIKVFAMNTINRDRRYIIASRAGVVREKYGIGLHEKIILSVARLEPEKNYQQMLSLFSQLENNFHFIALGQGSLANELKESSKKLGIEGRVHFAGFVERSDIWNYYHDADIFMLLSKAEALGVVFWEAMYMGVPVIGSPAEGIAESIGGDGERGFIFDDKKDDILSLKQKINFCVSTSQEKEIMIKKARQYVETQISNQTNINSIDLN